MGVVPPGDGVLELVRNATLPVVVVAPYIKLAAMKRLLHELPETVSGITCITRWLAEDIAAGVCDLEILELINQVPGGRLLVHPHLHAKYFSNQRKCLVGSANITARGLGWHVPSNVELLVSIPANYPGMQDWEEALMKEAIPATEDLRQQLYEEAERLKASGVVVSAPEVEASEQDQSLWLPSCPVPERLWQVYQGDGVDTMVSSALDAAQADLRILVPPPGLTQTVFEAYLGGVLRQMPLLAEIDRLASTGLTDLQAQNFLANQLGTRDDTSEYDQIWRTIKRWLVYFHPESFRTETGQEVLVKGREISRG